MASKYCTVGCDCNLLIAVVEYVLFHVLVELFLFGSKKCIICRTKLKLQIGVFPVNESCYVVEGAFSILQHFLATETCFKKMKNVFYITLKLFLFSRYLNFCLDFLVIQKKGFITKIRLISKFMTSQHGKKIIAMAILPNISRGKGSQTIKFGQLIEYNMRNFFFKK